MVEIEFIKDVGRYSAGDHARVDEISAQVLVKRDEAKVVEQVEPAEVESGGERARELNAQAAAEAEKNDAAESVTAADQSADAPAAEQSADDNQTATSKAPAAKGRR